MVFVSGGYGPLPHFSRQLERSVVHFYDFLM